MFSLRDTWRRWTSTRYTRLLEQELARLRAENRALLHSILGVAGIPPITVAVPQPLQSAPSPADRSTDPALDSEPLDSSHATSSPAHVAVPLRRRSWHQINRTLEIDSARKKEPSSPHPIPSPMHTARRSPL